jgi:hypothetical protein
MTNTVSRELSYAHELQTIVSHGPVASTNSGWKQRTPITQEDWDIQFPILKQLYLMEQRSLQDVMGIMEEKLGFVAT